MDLRGNGGGSGGLGQLLIRRTAKRPFKTGTKKWRYSKAYQEACLIHGLKQRHMPAWLHLEKVLSFHDFSPFKEMNLDMSELEGEWFMPSENGLQKPWHNAWSGTLVLICDRFTGSAAVSTAVIVKDNKLGLIVGEETGGRALRPVWSVRFRRCEGRPAMSVGPGPAESSPARDSRCCRR